MSNVIVENFYQILTCVLLLIWLTGLRTTKLPSSIKVTVVPEWTLLLQSVYNYCCKIMPDNSKN